MWKNYSARYFKNNKGLLFFLTAVSFLASLLLSLISSFFYNLWEDYVYRAYLQTGTKTVDITTAAKIYAAIMVLAAASLILMIYNTFGISMKARIRHLGILKSVGATPKQLKSVLVHETMGVCLLPALLGTAAGTFVCRRLIRVIIELGETVRTYEPTYRFSSWVFLLSFGISALTLCISAWIPAKKISRISVLDAMMNREKQPRKIRRFSLFSILFGIEGELAARSLYTRRKSLRISGAALFLAVMALFTFFNIERISALSVKETYWERYENVWDIRITATGNTEDNHALLTGVRRLEGVESCILYQTFDLRLRAGEKSIEATVFVMDNESFMQYRKECGLEEGAAPGQGVVIVNRIWDRENSDRTDRQYIPFLEKETETTVLSAGSGMGESGTEDAETAEMTANVIGLCDYFPALREEMGVDSLAVVTDEEYFRSLQGAFLQNETPQTFSDKESILNVKVGEPWKSDVKKSAEMKDMLSELTKNDVLAKGGILKESGETVESRLEEQADDERIRSGLRFIAAVAAAVLALTGLSNVFSSTLGQIRERKREFARYLSVGMSPKGLKKILWLEALKISAAPLLLSLLLNCPIVWFALESSGVALMDFLKNMPLGPILIFSFGIVFLVYLTYYIGEKQILSKGLIDVLKDDRFCE